MRTALDEDKKYFIGNSVLALVTIVFMVMLSNYNQKLYLIQEQYPNAINQALIIAQEEYYWQYLCAGFILLALLVGVLVYYKQKCLLISFLCLLLINVILFIILILIFWNPIVTTFAVIMAILVIAMFAK